VSCRIKALLDSPEFIANICAGDKGRESVNSRARRVDFRLASGGAGGRLHRFLQHQPPPALVRSLACTPQHRYDDAIADDTQSIALYVKLDFPAWIARR
jgi:hypothetical protein